MEVAVPFSSRSRSLNLKPSTLFFFHKVSNDKVHMGCSKTLSEDEVGCRSTVEPCNPVVLLQLSTNSKVRNIWFLSPLVMSKQENLALLSLYTF